MCEMSNSSQCQKIFVSICGQIVHTFHICEQSFKINSNIYHFLDTREIYGIIVLCMKIHKREDSILIEVKNLTKNYGTTSAVDDVSFKIRDGRIYGFLGPNGAGKSTTMNIISGCHNYGFE